MCVLQDIYACIKFDYIESFVNIFSEIQREGVRERKREGERRREGEREREREKREKDKRIDR